MSAKQAGSSCPSCGAMPCAEFALKDMPPRWKCNGCGAAGELAGAFMARGKPAVAAAPTVKKHWRDKAAAP